MVAAIMVRFFAIHLGFIFILRKRIRINLKPFIGLFSGNFFHHISVPDSRNTHTTVCTDMSGV